MTWRVHCRRPAAGQKGQGHQGFPAPLDSPTFPLDATPFGRASKNEGPQGRLVLQGHILDRSGAFRSRTLPLCTVWPRTVMRGGLRKGNSGHNSIPKSARRTEPSPRNLRLAANASLSGLKEGLGVKREREPSVPCPILSPPPDGGIPPPWIRRPPCPSAAIIPSDKTKAPTQSRCFLLLERLTRLELATSTLARWRSTR